MDARESKMNDRETFGGPNDSFDKFFFLSAFIIEIITLFFFGLFTDYADASDLSSSDESMLTYGMYQDVHVMILVGFGFLMTFLKKYAFGALSYNLLISAIAYQWGMIIFVLVATGHIFDEEEPLTYTFSAANLVDGDVAAAAVLISFGAVLGRASPTQLLWMAFFELIIYSFNFYICVEAFHIVDVGGSIVVHSFGCYFGLAVSYILGEAPNNSDDNGSVYHSDVFSMIGTLFLWIYWPSFNGFFASEAGHFRERAFINTVLSLSSCTVVTFVLSKLYVGGKFQMVHVQNATLAGGVAVGAAADLYIHPLGACVTGIVAGIVSVVGYSKISDVLELRFDICDTCGVNNLHGMPGVLGGIVSAVAILAASNSGTKIYADDTFWYDYGTQASIQLAAVVMTLGMAIFGGIIVGQIIKKIDQFNPFAVKEYFNDSDNFEMPEPLTLAWDNFIRRASILRRRRGSSIRRPGPSAAQIKDRVSRQSLKNDNAGGSGQNGHKRVRTVTIPPPAGGPPNSQPTVINAPPAEVTVRLDAVNLNAGAGGGAGGGITSHIGRPHPLGLFGLAVGALLVFTVDLDAVDASPNIVPWLYMVPAAAQGVAGILGFLRGDTFGGILFASQSVYWFGLGVTVSFGDYSREDGKNANLYSTGVVSIGYVLLSLILSAIAAGINKILLGINMFLTLSFICAAMSIFEGWSVVLEGLCLFGVFCLAMYGIAAEVINEVAGGRVLTLGKPIIDWSKRVRANKTDYSENNSIGSPRNQLPQVQRVYSSHSQSGGPHSGGIVTTSGMRIDGARESNASSRADDIQYANEIELDNRTNATAANNMNDINALVQANKFQE